jgi:hypothetical protein
MDVEAGGKRVWFILAITLAIVTGATLYWFYFSKKAAPEIPVTNNDQTSYEGGVDLGTTVYEKANNPISDKLPDTLAPVANPIADIYKNPFE